MDYYHYYKPLRNLLRTYNLNQCLVDIWWYFREMTNPSVGRIIWNGERYVKPRDVLLEWELAALAKEIILHAKSDGTLRLSEWDNLAKAINKMRRVSNEMASTHMTPTVAYHSMSPTAQFQLPWQRKVDVNSLMRYYKVFSEKSVDEILVAETGVDTKTWYVVGLLIWKHFQEKSCISSLSDFGIMGVSLEKSQIIFKSISKPIDDCRELINSSSKYDNTWAYSWNPLEAAPLIGIDKRSPDRLYCPVPRYILSRVTKGLFYEISKSTSFNNPFGRSFEIYIGDILYKVFNQNKFKIYKETEYKKGKIRKDGVDWILIDNNANIFIECKSKRMRVDAKSSYNIDVIAEQVDFLARAVVQLYKNIKDALDGLTHWPKNDKPIFPMVLTLEDWYLLGVSAEILDRNVRDRMRSEGLNISMLETMPYTVASSEAFENVSRIIEEVGIGCFFESKFREGKTDWMLQNFAHEKFSDLYRKYARDYIFKDEWDELLKELSSENDKE